MILRQVLQIKGDFHRRLSTTDTGDPDIRIRENLKRTCIMSVLRFDWRTTSERSKDFDVKGLEEIYVAPSASTLQLLAAPRGAALWKPLLCSFILLTYFKIIFIYAISCFIYSWRISTKQTSFLPLTINTLCIFLLQPHCWTRQTSLTRLQIMTLGCQWRWVLSVSAVLALLPRGDALRCTAGTFHHT